MLPFLIIPSIIVLIRPSIKPSTITVWWVASAFIIACINCVWLAPAFPILTPTQAPDFDVSVQYDNAAQIYLLPLGYVAFLGYVTPRLAWLFLLCPLLMLLTGVGSARALSVFFPFGFVRCANKFLLHLPYER